MNKTLKKTKIGLLPLVLTLAGVLSIGDRLNSQISIIPKVGLITDIVSLKSDIELVSLIDGFATISPTYDLEVRYKLADKVEVSMFGSYTIQKRKAESSILFDPILEMRYRTWIIGYDVLYMTQNDIFIGGGINLSIIDTNKFKFLHQGWQKVDYYTNSNILNINFGIGYEYNAWVVCFKGSFPVKAFTSNGLIKSRTVLSLSVGRRFGIK